MSRVPMTSRLSAAARREQLLAVALEVFARAGYHDTSMNDVADAAGVTKPVLYQHFESKRDLYQALLDDVGARMLNAIRDATADATDGRSGPSSGSAPTSAGSPTTATRSCCCSAAAPVATRSSPGGAPGHRGMVHAIAPLIDADIDDEHRLTLAHALVGLAEAASRRLVERGQEFDPDEVAPQLGDLAWAGLRSVHR